jgi:hypothetical protein
MPALDEERMALGRRDVLKSAAGAVAAMMLQPGWVATARAQSPALKADPRFAFIDCVSELTIPTTDTPGASAALVPAFVLLALDQHLTGLDPTLLPLLQTQLDKDAGGSFLSSSAPDQLRILKALDTAAYAATAHAGTAAYAWRRIKAAIVAGYYTSEIGAAKELVYEPIPGHGGNIILGPEYRARSDEGFGGRL